jgi:hypothetical protein
MKLKNKAIVMVATVFCALSVSAQDVNVAANVGAAKAAAQISKQQAAEAQKALRKNPNDPNAQAAFSQATVNQEVANANAQAWRQVQADQRRAEQQARASARRQPWPLKMLNGQPVW